MSEDAASDPPGAGCWLELGRRQAASGKFQDAEASFRRADSSDAGVPSGAWMEFGVTQALAGRFEGAARAFSRALELDPGGVAALVNLGNTLRLLGRLGEAEATLRQAVAAAPDVAEAHDNLGLALSAGGDQQGALACHDRAVRLKPTAPSGHVHRGLALEGLGRLDDAEAAFGLALELDPGCRQALTRLGLLRGRRGDREGALRRHLAASVLRPDDPEACNNLGNALRALGRVDEAVACFERALRLEPGFVEAVNNLAITRLQHGRVAEAEAGFRQALALHPGFAEAHVNFAHVRLGLGDLARGWPEFEWRRKFPDSRVGALPGPEWDGAALEGRVVVVHAEQGQGDAIQFVRFAARARERGARVWLKAPRALVSLLARCPGVERALDVDEPAPGDALHIPMMSLPGRLGVDRLEQLAEPAPYLSADEHLSEALRARLDCGERLRVGIAWQGNPRFPEDWHRSIPLREFLPLSRVEGTRFFVLQRGPGLEQIAALPDAWRPRMLTTSGHEEWRWEHTAAVIRHLDLVITSDTAIAHLAGAMGRPVWVALSAAADWRWLRDRTDSPWYPTMKLFRQTTWRAWDDVFDRIAAALAGRRAEPLPRSPEPPVGRPETGREH